MESDSLSDAPSVGRSHSSLLAGKPEVRPYVFRGIFYGKGKACPRPGRYNKEAPSPRGQRGTVCPLVLRIATLPPTRRTQPSLKMEWS